MLCSSLYFETFLFRHLGVFCALVMCVFYAGSFHTAFILEDQSLVFGVALETCLCYVLLLITSGVLASSVA